MWPRCLTGTLCAVLVLPVSLRPTVATTFKNNIITRQGFPPLVHGTDSVAPLSLSALPVHHSWDVHKQVKVLHMWNSRLFRPSAVCATGTWRRLTCKRLNDLGDDFLNLPPVLWPCVLQSLPTS